MVNSDRESRLDQLLGGFIGEHKDAVSGIGPEAVTPDYVANYLENMPEKPDSSVDRTIKTRTEELLEAFFKGGAQLVLSKPDISDAESDDLTDRETAASDSCCTEALARIYLKQHRYDKALEIIRSLYLNFPNKSIYFADQIRYLEKLVVINQKQ